ncbi:MAG: DUF4831 family protein [Bacteroidales bacterium]|nr:DUF4831 family protein [Bacteroidales bacterium]MDD4293468.1 DUF4831 family protein [Bacteroidales bacterium]HNW48609.1 DUF4831 family protein [Bacteroidales bacterium]HPS95110.1 DUF4831 family protein [Bacteroidales bacterium]
MDNFVSYTNINYNYSQMNRFLKLTVTIVALFVFINGKSQVLAPGEAVPQGAIVYSLPLTSFRFVAEAAHESFIAGPYAKYAQKYLGIQARETSGEIYTLSSVQLIPYTEADRSSNIALNIGNSKTASANFLEMTSQGLIIWSDSRVAKGGSMRFPAKADMAAFEKSQSTSNLTSVNTTLYKTVQTATGLERVPVQQSQVVEKSLEKRAEETAGLIFRLRTKRMEIITGETDATFSGDALRAAIDEINRLEDEYLTLFTGKSVSDTQKMEFDVVPKAENTKQFYVAFRISESQGLLTSDNVSGRPVVLELIQDGDNASKVNMDLTLAKGRVLYRKPAIMNARVSDGQNLLLQTRVAVYQLGSMLSFPIEIATGK